MRARYFCRPADRALKLLRRSFSVIIFTFTIDLINSRAVSFFFHNRLINYYQIMSVFLEVLQLLRFYLGLLLRKSCFITERCCKLK